VLKTKTIKLLCVCLLLVLQCVSFARPAFANISNIQVRQLSVAEGLSQGSVTDIVEDQHGFIWSATTGGLSRFDGYEFVQYHHNPSVKDSLPDPFIRNLFLDDTNRLWLSTINGLARYQPETDNFVTYNKSNSSLFSNDIWSVGQTTDGKIIVAGVENLYQYDSITDDFVVLTPKGLPVPASIRFIYPEKDRTWLGSREDGVFMLDNRTNTLYKLSESNPWGFDIEAQLFDIKKYDNQYWLATDSGVYVFSETDQQVAHYSADSDIPIAGTTVRTIEREANGNIWLGTDNGISVIDSLTQKVISIDENNSVHVGLNDTFIIKLFKDSNDSIWIGTYVTGLHHYYESFADIKHFKSVPNSPASLSNDVVWGLQEDNQGQIWIATQSGGVNLFDPENVVFTHFLQNAELTIWDIVLDQNQNVWLATSNGIFVYRRTEDELQEIAHLFQGEMTDRLGYFADKVWVWSGDSELVSIDPANFEINIQKMPDTNFTSVMPIYLDSSQNLWLKTNLGLTLFNLQTKHFNQLIFNLEDTAPIFLDVVEKDQVFWVVTAKQGLLELDKTSYSVLNKVPPWQNESSNRFISSIASNDSLWLATHNRIYEFSLATATVVSTISKEMLDYNDLNEGARLVTKNGHIMFGGTKGFHLFEPKRFDSASSYKSKAPVITKLAIFNRPVTIKSPESPLELPIHLSSEITLENKMFQFSLGFAQVNTLKPNSQSYRYKLDGLSDDWLIADARSRQATFTNLMFGNYNFYVQSRENKGPWSPSAHLKITIKPPIWLHRNAIVIYGFFIFLMLAYGFKQYKTKHASQMAIQESEERLKLTLWSSGDELWDWDIYRGQVFRANTWGTLDFPQDNIRANSSYQANIHPDDISKVQDALNEHIDQETDHFQATYRTRTFNGDWIWLLDRGKVVRRDNNNQPLRMTGTLKNISHLKQAEEQLKLFKRSIETISDGVFIADTTFKFISVNQSYCRYTGETREQALASYLTFHQYPEAFTEEVKKSLQQKGNWLGEVESRRSNGEKYEMELNIDAVQGEGSKITHYVGVFSDITSRKSTEKELLKLANTDPLTEMPNRSFYQASHANLVRKGVPHALICLDMDNFKKINDSLGHQTGDILIKQIGKRLQKISGTNSTCYRLGGDEFSILLDNTTDMHRITHFAQHILDDMARPFMINKQEFVLGASVGIAFYPEDGNTPQEMLKNADIAMYFAKNAGGNKYQFFSGEMNQNAVRQLQIENLIRHGLKEDLFTVFYQPKVDIASGRLVSMEALVRFEDPVKGIVSPSQFIPLAEETGQIVEIGERVMQKACEDTKRWVSMGLFTGRVAINISARQFELGDLDTRIDKILQKVGLSPLHLECEITEGTIMQNPDQALRMMERLRERGIHLALDDFGTGYSSLAYLKKFPLNTLKIDKAFIDDIATSSVDKHMTAAIINIAHNLGLKVVAEGVEQEKQLAILRRYECEMLQGYLYSKPLSSARFERLLTENQHLTELMQSSDN
jgi:diguanylate cyclase (GGDEF)-like protein/PAS domain S-box-containing protein